MLRTFKTRWKAWRMRRSPGFERIWDEAGYLGANADVAAAVAKGTYADGLTHFVAEPAAWQRPGWRVRSAPGKADTRVCLDPWSYAEVSAEGGLRPCCNYEPLGTLAGEAGIESIREGAAFRRLRGELLEGKLSANCDRCHIREHGQAAQLRFILKNSLGLSDAGLLDSGRLTDIRIDLNERCNLRCVYCAVSQPGYKGVEMSDEVFARCEEFIARQPGPLTISLNGHGETTYHRKWVDYTERLLRFGHRITMISNFAKRFDARELAALARLQAIQISLDSADEELMRAVRRHVSLKNIVGNIVGVRAKAAELGVTPPSIGFSSGIYDPSVWQLERFADFLVEQRAQFVTFWSLKEYPSLPEATIAVRSLDHLPDEQRDRARQLIGRMRERLVREHISYMFAGDFRDGAGVSYV
jgi:sulfatase maturation enzyme AslB (radical SAM superfamily)